jgi:type II secretory pathway component PulM
MILVMVVVVITMRADAAAAAAAADIAAADPDAVQNALFVSLTESQLQGQRLCSADDGQWWQHVMAMQVLFGLPCVVSVSHVVLF